MPSYLFSLGNSSDGPVGFCARVTADTKEEALQVLHDVIDGLEGFLSAPRDILGDQVEYLNAYFNVDAITVDDIAEAETEGFDVDEARDLVVYVIDDAGSGRKVGEDMHAKVRVAATEGTATDGVTTFKYSSRILAWESEDDDPLVVAVHSYLDVPLADEEAIKLAIDYLKEAGEFDKQAYESTLQPDWILCYPPKEKAHGKADAQNTKSSSSEN